MPDGATEAGSRVQLLACLHIGPVVVPDEMEQRMDERLPPVRADDVRADDDVAELARQAVRQLVEAVEREGERVGRLVDAEVLALQRAALLRPDEREPELAGVYSTYAADTPQIYLDIDRDKAQILGVPLSNVFQSLQA